MNITLYDKIFAAMINLRILKMGILSWIYTGGPYMQLYVPFKREAVKILHTEEKGNMKTE